jgi:hypothetical protein
LKTGKEAYRDDQPEPVRGITLSADAKYFGVYTKSYAVWWAGFGEPIKK